MCVYVCVCVGDIHVRSLTFGMWLHGVRCVFYSVSYWCDAASRFLHNVGWLPLKCDGARADTIFRLSAKRTSPFKSEGASIPSNAGSRGVRMSCINAGYTMFRGSVKSTGYPLRSPVSPSIPLPCLTECHLISTGLYCNYTVARPSRLNTWCCENTRSDRGQGLKCLHVMDAWSELMIVFCEQSYILRAFIVWTLHHCCYWGE
jgi:hypothetical protein